MSTTAPVLEVDGLVKHFPVTRGLIRRKVIGMVRAVEGVSFDIARGETLALVGESGCGKSTTGRLVLRLMDPTAGSVRFKGSEIADLDKQSLRRLRTDRLDCYLLHWRGSYPLAETFAAFEELRAEGKILSWGVSNFDVADLDEALRIAGPGRIACNQVLYHLRERAIEHAVVPWCERNGVAVTAYSPFGQDDFPEAGSSQGKVLAEIATAYDASPRQVALAFLTRNPCVFAVPKAAKASHAQDNAGALKLELGDADIAKLDAAFPRGPKPRGLPML